MPTVLIVAPGRILRSNHVRYRAGQQVPAGLPAGYVQRGLDDGLFVKVELREDAPPPTKGEPVERAFNHPEWDRADPDTIANVPVRLILQLLGSVHDAAQVRKIQEAEAGRSKPRSTVARFCRERLKQLAA